MKRGGEAKPDPYAGLKYDNDCQLLVQKIHRKMVEDLADRTAHFVSLDLPASEDTRREIHDLLVRSERAHREALEYWLPRYTKEGGEHRPPRRWKKAIKLAEEMDFVDDDDRLAQEEWYEEEEWPKYFAASSVASRAASDSDAGTVSTTLAVPS